MRRLLVTVDAGERECGACPHKDWRGGELYRCELFGDERLAWSGDDDGAGLVRLTACLAAEQAAEQKEAGR